MTESYIFKCPSCNEDFDLHEDEFGYSEGVIEVECPSCGTELGVKYSNRKALEAEVEVSG